MISTGQAFQDVCTKRPKWFRRVKELFRAKGARRHIRPRRGAVRTANAPPGEAFYPLAPAQATLAVAAVANRACPKVPDVAIRTRRGRRLAGAARRLAAEGAADRPAASRAAAPGRPGLPAFPAAVPAVACPVSAILAGLAGWVSWVGLAAG